MVGEGEEEEMFKGELSLRGGRRGLCVCVMESVKFSACSILEGERMWKEEFPPSDVTRLWLWKRENKIAILYYMEKYGFGIIFGFSCVCVLSIFKKRGQ